MLLLGHQSFSNMSMTNYAKKI